MCGRTDQLRRYVVGWASPRKIEEPWLCPDCARPIAKILAKVIKPARRPPIRTPKTDPHGLVLPPQRAQEADTAPNGAS